MNIAIDVQPLYSTHNTRGIGKYTFYLLRNIFSLDKKNNYYIINHYGETSAKDRLDGGKNVTELNFYSGSKQFLVEDATPESRLYFKRITKKIIEEYNIDIFHITAVVDQFDVYESSFFKKTKLISTIYDLIPLIFAEHYLAGGTYPRKYCKCLEQYLFSDMIFSDSESAKEDANFYLKADKNRIKTIYSGVDEGFDKINYSIETIKKINKKFAIVSPYLICVGADDFRKNLHRLVEAFGLLPKNVLDNYQLVIVCSMRDEMKNQLKNLASTYNCRERVVITGYINDEEMLCLLNNAHLAVFPSMYEGFGLPIVEAWKCEIPVLTSNNSSLGEIAEDAAITVNPFDKESITKGLLYALTEADLNNLIQKGTEKLKKYSWVAVAQSVLQSYEFLLEKSKMTVPLYEIVYKKQNLESQCLKYVLLEQTFYMRFVSYLKSNRVTLPVYKVLYNIKQLIKMQSN